jgi:uncharacterized protein (TIGR03066 family)
MKAVRWLSATLIAVVVLSTLASAGAQDKDKAKPKDLIVGKWEPADDGGKGIVIEFTKDGALRFSYKDQTFDGKYTFLDDDNIDVELTALGQTKKTKMKVKVTKDELITIEDSGGKTKEGKFKRIK